MVTPFAKGALLRAAPAPISIETLTGGGDVLVLAPHPDDESLGCGLAIAAACRAGARVTVVALTDGSLSHPNSARYPGPLLGALRLAELEEAVAILTAGTGRVVPLFYRDQHAPRTEAEITRAALYLAALVDDLSPKALWTTWEGDPHCDHQSAARIAARLAVLRPRLKLFSFPVWGRFTDPAFPPPVPPYRFEAPSLRPLKERAVLAHRSQMTGLIDDDPDGFVMAEETRRHFVESPELFLPGPSHG